MGLEWILRVKRLTGMCGKHTLFSVIRYRRLVLICHEECDEKWDLGNCLEGLKATFDVLWNMWTMIFSKIFSKDSMLSAPLYIKTLNFIIIIIILHFCTVWQYYHCLLLSLWDNPGWWCRHAARLQPGLGAVGLPNALNRYKVWCCCSTLKGIQVVNRSWLGWCSLQCFSCSGFAVSFPKCISWYEQLVFSLCPLW